MAKDRARDARRTVGSHEKMMGALGKAAGWWDAGSTAYGRASFGPSHLGVKNFVIPGKGHVKTNASDAKSIEGVEGIK